MALRVELVDLVAPKLLLGSDYCGSDVAADSISGLRGRALGASVAIGISLAKNNQLRTGADKGNPTV